MVRGLTRRDAGLPHATGLRRLLGPEMVLLVVALLFLPTLRYPFVALDDPYFIIHNPAIRDLSWGGIFEIFFQDQREWRYFPLTYVSFAVDHALAGLEPAVYHGTNVLLHLANAALVWLLVLRLSGNALAAFLTALLFGIHPLQVESVAWVMGRKNVLFLFFFLVSLLAYLAYARAGPRDRARARLAFAGSWVAFGLAVFAKPAAVTLPALLVLIDHHLEPEPPRRFVPFLVRSIPPKLLYLPAIVFSWVMTARLSEGSPFAVELPFDALQWATITAHNLFFYVVKAAVPTGLGVFYPLPIGAEGPFLPAHFGPFALLGLGLVGLALGCRRRSPTLFFGIAWYLVTILPMAAQPWIFRDLPLLAADRYFYQSAIGLFFAVAMGFAAAWQRAPVRGRILRAGWVAVAVGVVGISFALSWKQRQVWRGSIPLYEQTVRHHPSDALYYRLAIEYAAKERMGPAFLALEQAERARFQISFLRIFSYQMRLSDLYRRHGEPAKAAALLEAAIASTPNPIEPVRTATPLAYRYLAHLRELGGDPAGAAAARELARSAEPEPRSYFEHLWFIIAPKASLHLLEAQVASEPEDAVAWFYLGQWYEVRSRPELGRRYRQRAAELGFDPPVP